MEPLEIQMIKTTEGGKTIELPALVTEFISFSRVCFMHRSYHRVQNGLKKENFFISSLHLKPQMELI